MIMLYLAVKGFQALFWCFAAMMWLCFASAGAMLVLIVGTITLGLGDRGHVLRSGFRSIAPPAYLRGKSRT